MPLLLLGEPALDQRRIVIRLFVSHAFLDVRVAKKPERVHSLGMVLEVESGAKNAATAPGGIKGRRRGTLTYYFAAGVLAASNFSAKPFCCLSSF